MQQEDEGFAGKSFGQKSCFAKSLWDFVCFSSYFRCFWNWVISGKCSVVLHMEVLLYDRAHLLVTSRDWLRPQIFNFFQVFDCVLNLPPSKNLPKHPTQSHVFFHSFEKCQIWFRKNQLSSRYDVIIGTASKLAGIFVGIYVLRAMFFYGKLRFLGNWKKMC